MNRSAAHDALIRQAEMLGRRYDVEVHHVRMPVYDRRGWPDLFLLGTQAAIARELKTGRAVPTADQVETGRRLAIAGIDFRIWHEEDFLNGDAERQIAELSGRQPWI